MGYHSKAVAPVAPYSTSKVLEGWDVSYDLGDLGCCLASRKTVEATTPWVHEFDLGADKGRGGLNLSLEKS